MNSGWYGSSSRASCRAMPLCNRPWKSTPTSSPSARTSRRRCTAPSSAVGESIHATASAHTHQQSTSTTGPPRTGCIHLHRGEPLRLAPLCRRKQPREVVAADPPVHAHAVAHRAAEQRVHGHAERLSLDVPQRDVEPRERALRPWAMQSESAGYISAPGRRGYAPSARARRRRSGRARRSARRPGCGPLARQRSAAGRRARPRRPRCAPRALPRPSRRCRRRLRRARRATGAARGRSAGPV